MSNNENNAPNLGRVINATDVVVGPGSQHATNPPSLVYRGLLENKAEEYWRAGRDQKRVIAEELVDSLYDRGYRFVRQSKWRVRRVVSRETIVNGVIQHLRERANRLDQEREAAALEEEARVEREAAALEEEVVELEEEARVEREREEARREEQVAQPSVRNPTSIVAAAPDNGIGSAPRGFMFGHVHGHQVGGDFHTHNTTNNGDFHTHNTTNNTHNTYNTTHVHHVNPDQLIEIQDKIGDLTAEVGNLRIAMTSKYDHLSNQVAGLTSARSAVRANNAAGIHSPVASPVPQQPGSSSWSCCEGETNANADKFGKP